MMYLIIKYLYHIPLPPNIFIIVANWVASLGAMVQLLLDYTLRI